MKFWAVLLDFCNRGQEVERRFFENLTKNNGFDMVPI